MSDISSFYTKQTGGSAPLGASSQNAAVISGAQPGAQFLDMLLASLLTGKPQDITATDGTAGTGSETTGESSQNPGENLFTTLVKTADDPSSAQGESVPDSSALTAAISLLPADSAAAAPVTDAAPVIDTTAAISSGSEDPVLTTIDTALKKQIESLAPVATVAPTEVPQIATPTATIAIPASILPAANENTGSAAAIQIPQGPFPADTEPTPQIAAQLNALVPGVKPEEKQSSNGKPTNLLEGLLRTGLAEDGYQGLSTPEGRTYQSILNAATNPANQNATKIPDHLMTPGLSTADTLGGDPLFTVDLTSLDGSVRPGLVTASTHITTAAASPSSATGMAQQTLSAVAAQLVQMAQTRDNRSLTLQLNPPELGRLQVKMNYGADKRIRADIAVEKPDTLTMLQKDSDVLRQVLNGAGLQADAGSLNFSLADSGSFAGQMDQHASNGSSLSDETEDVTVIEIKTREVWTVDPKTGETHYDILV